MFEDKGKGGYNESSRGYDESGLTYDESSRAESHDESTRGSRGGYAQSTQASTQGTTTRGGSEYSGRIEILESDTDSEDLETVPEDEEVSDDDESSESVSGSQSFTDLEDEESGKKHESRRCPKRYPLWLCPPFWLLHPKKAYRNRSACIANLVLIGCCVYYFILVNVDVDNPSVTEYLWFAPTLVILYTANLIKKNLKLTKVVVALAERVQYQINIQNEMADDINKLGEKGRKYRQEVVNLMDVINETKQAGKRLEWRNEQSVREVDRVDEYITKYKPKAEPSVIEEEEEEAETDPGDKKKKGKKKKKKGDKEKDEEKEENKESPEEVVEVQEVPLGEAPQTQGKLVQSREQISTKREDLNQRIDEHHAVLDDVKEGISMLQEYHDQFTNESEEMKNTLNQFQATVDEFDTQVGRLEDLKEYSKNPMDASNADMREYLTEIHIKKERLRKLTVVMEVSIMRDRFLSSQYRTGESGMDRETFDSIKKEIPIAAQRAIRNMKNRGTFDVLRVQSKKKILDNKLGRKKRPGIDNPGMKAFLESVEAQMRADMNKPLKSLLRPNVNIET